MVRGVIDGEGSLGSGIVAWKTEPVRGATFETLCAPCNNRTGSWYNPAYVAFTEICRPLASAKTAGRLNSFSVALHRQRIVKQALASLIATSQPGLTARYPHLRTFLVEKEDRRPLAPVQLWLYLRANPGGMFTGLTIALSIERQQDRLVGGFSFWPLGWLMTIGDVMIEGATNVSGWTDLDYHDKSVATLEIPCEWAVSTYPGDFRSPEQIAAEAWTVRPAP
jgi:hypothetical protein